MRKYSILAAAIICLHAALVRAEEVVRVACVGDSITYGAGVANRGKNNYPKVLGGLLGPGTKAETLVSAEPPCSRRAIIPIGGPGLSRRPPSSSPTS